MFLYYARTSKNKTTYYFPDNENKRGGRGKLHYKQFVDIPPFPVTTTYRYILNRTLGTFWLQPTAGFVVFQFVLHPVVCVFFCARILLASFPLSSPLLRIRMSRIDRCRFRFPKTDSGGGGRTQIDNLYPNFVKQTRTSHKVVKLYFPSLSMCFFVSVLLRRVKLSKNAYRVIGFARSCVSLTSQIRRVANTRYGIFIVC